MGSISVWHWIIVLFVMIVLVLPTVFYILSFQKTATVVNAGSPERTAPVKSAWLLLVPVFAVVWFFVLLLRLRESVSDARLGTTRSLWWTYGLIAGILYVLTYIGSSVSPIIGILILVGWFVFAILHWVELVALRSEVQKNRAALNP